MPGVGGSGVEGAETKLISEGDWMSLCVEKGVVNGGGMLACFFADEDDEEPQPTKRLNCCLNDSFFLLSVLLLLDGRMIDDEDVGVTSKWSIIRVESEFTSCCCSSMEEPDRTEEDWAEERLLKPRMELGDFVLVGKEEEEEDEGEACWVYDLRS